MSYFVTGATGFIGRYLVAELLARSDSSNDGSGQSIYVLVRSASSAKLAELMRWWGTEAERVVPIEGDLAAPGLGIDKIHREQLRGKVTHFFHLAAVYDLEATAEAMEAANIDGTRHALEFAHFVHAGCFHLFSSIASAGLYDGVFMEEMFDEARGLDHPYFRTKHESEALVRRNARVPWRIYRPGMVVGHSQTGHITKVDGPYYFFKMQQILRRNLPSWVPMVGIEGGYVNVVPVDYVVRAVAHLAHLEGYDRQCFHITDPDARRVGEVMNIFSRAGHAPLMGVRIDNSLLKLLPPHLLDSVGRYEPLQKIVDQLMDDLQVPRVALKFLNLPTRFDNHRTQQLLEAADIRLPRLEDYAWRLWDYWERHLDPELFLDRSLRGAVSGKRVLITGGSTGIGKATALKLADAGAIVLIASLGEDDLQKTHREIEARGGKVSSYECNLTDAASCEELVKRIRADHGGVDILVNNAGHSIRRSIGISYDRFHDYERLMQINYFAAVRLTLALLPDMVERGRGQVIVISSIGVLSNQPRFSAYVASKAALEAFARCAASEYRDQGVAFTVINMPLVRTRMIAPTKAYRHVHTLTPEEAADHVVDAIIRRPPRLMTRLGMFARFMELFAPKMTDIINATEFHMFPDSAAARGSNAEEEPPSQDAVTFANLLKGLHW